MNVAIIILAAGGSSRLGRPKQLMPVNAETLLHRTTRVALESKASQVTVVLGAHAGVCGVELSGLPVRLAFNPVWRDGQASSIVAGLKDVRRHPPHPDAVVILACDQPLLTSSVIDGLIEAHRELGKGMVACRYAGTNGVPALFSRRYFDALLRLEGERGAKVLFQDAPEDLACTAFEDGWADIDTMEDYARFQSEQMTEKAA